MRHTALAIASITLWSCSGEAPVPALPGDSGVPAVEADAAMVVGAPYAAATTFPDATVTSSGADGGAPLIDSCNPITQNCLAPIDKCVVEPQMGRSGTTCAERDPADKPRDAVCGGSDCQAGLACVRTGTVGRCLLACDRTTGEPCSTLGADADCRLQIRGTNWGACEQLPPICDALTQAPCPVDQACQPVRRFNGMFEYRCRPPGTGMNGDRCENSGCVRGQLCVREEAASSFCRKPCGDDSGCTMPETCSRVVLGVKYCRAP